MNWRDVECPHYSAAAGESCFYRRHGVSRTTRAHEIRRSAAREAEEVRAAIPPDLRERMEAAERSNR